jgi:hypothetical protein
VAALPETGLLLKSFKDGGIKFYATIAIIERLKFDQRQLQALPSSDTFSDVFLECLEGETGNSLTMKD